MIILRDLINRCLCDTKIVIKYADTDKCTPVKSAYDTLNILNDKALNCEVQTIHVDNSAIVIRI